MSQFTCILIIVKLGECSMTFTFSCLVNKYPSDKEIDVREISVYASQTSSTWSINLVSRFERVT